MEKKKPTVVYRGLSESNRELAETLTKEQIAELFEEYDFQLAKDACLVSYIQGYIHNVDDIKMLKMLVENVLDFYNNTYMVVIKKGDVING